MMQFASGPCKSDSVNASRIHLKWQEEFQAGKRECLCPQPVCSQDDTGELGLVAPRCCLSCQLLVLSKSLKPLGTLSPPCCKMRLSLVVLKLALQASSEGCSKTGGAFWVPF